MRFFDSMTTPALVLLGCLAALAGCPDPQGEYDAFKERFEALNTGGASGCEPAPAVAGAADGQYLFALSAKLSPPKAFVLDATLTTTEGADGGLNVELSLQPLSAEDQATPVGEPLVAEGLTIEADGTFTWDFGLVTLIGAANPITGADVESTLIFEGSICGPPNQGFICGDASGIVSKPLQNYDLTGSTFTMQRYEGDALPDPLINCDKEPAVY